ncbi:hypothetical protein [Hydrogenophaga sp.]|uniref:hypothetical protein n=1 Tax=Hydrogenophaga sp. TaxID=1904254 RepID=UPI002614324E|nr:hypothetical protein [Hydrogenophaga sp.]MDM7950090.1 hypothetical protein [Hydrogenophaga sp.]
MKAVLALALLLPVMASAATSYLCVADKATGMGFDKASGVWEVRTFRADSKYLVSEATEREEAIYAAKWLVKKMGSSSPTLLCPEGFSEIGFLFCENLGEFKFNRKSGRYLRSYTMGYFNDMPGKAGPLRAEGDDTPAIEIGKCSPIN